MSKLYDLQELVNHTGLPERTVRYYLAKVLEAPGGTRGRKAYYSQETLDQLKLAKQILMRPYDPKRGEVKPSLRDFQRWLKSHTAEEVHTMAEMPYRIKPKTLMSVSAPEIMESSPSGSKEEMKKTKDSAADYLDRVMGAKRQAHAQPHHRKDTRDAWRRYRFGDDLEIRIRKRLTTTQKQQLKLAGQLLQSMLEKE